MNDKNICNKCANFFPLASGKNEADAYCLSSSNSSIKLIKQNYTDNEPITTPSWCDKQNKNAIERPQVSLKEMAYNEREACIIKCCKPKIAWDDIKEGMQLVLPPIGYQKLKIIQVVKKEKDSFTYKEVNQASSYSYSYTMTVNRNSSEYAMLSLYRKF